MEVDQLKKEVSQNLELKEKSNYNEDVVEEDDTGVLAEASLSFRRNGDQDFVRWKGTEGIEKYQFITDLSPIQYVAARHSVIDQLKIHLDKLYPKDKLNQLSEGPKRTIWEKMFNKKKKKLGITI